MSAEGDSVRVTIDFEPDRKPVYPSVLEYDFADWAPGSGTGYFSIEIIREDAAGSITWDKAYEGLYQYEGIVGDEYGMRELESRELLGTFYFYEDKLTGIRGAVLFSASTNTSSLIQYSFSLKDGEILLYSDFFFYDEPFWECFSKAEGI